MNFKNFGWLAALLAVIWVVEAVNLVTGNAVNAWLGLRPRSIGGLDGIVFMPLLHGSVAHAAANTPPLAVLGALLVITARSVALMASLLIVLLGGLGVWVFGTSAIHVGASGLIFGWFGFLVARGLVERRFVPLLVAVGVAVIYGAMVWGVLPGQPGVSWESHFFGALAGIVAARALRGTG